MTLTPPESLIQQLAIAVTGEHQARTCGAWALQQQYMQQICELRRQLVLRERDDELSVAIEQLTQDKT